jgi:hypothetical protein
MGKNNDVVSLIVRYSLIFVAGLGGLWVFYTLFSFLTIPFVSFLIGLIEGGVGLIGHNILVSGAKIELVGACVAGSAYYLLFILNLSTPKIGIRKRVYSLFFCFGLFYIVNVLRILLFYSLIKTSYFEMLHMTTWYFLSGVFVFLIWFWNIKIFNIKKIPVYSDFKELLKQTKDS